MHRGAEICQLLGSESGDHMRKLIVIAMAAVGLLAAPMAQAGSDTDRATGGGQVLVSTEGGAGDTIAFTAQGTPSGAKGEVQYVDRTGGVGTGAVRYHGTVTCLRVEGNTAKIGGTWDRSTGTFQILVVDHGEGVADDDDVVELQNNTPNDCADDDDFDDADVALARGNAQVYDAAP
jgi:hypothetical protein